ncbi:MAG: hypothetical protein JSV19_04200 [Phycisphaerales bacterium]|nr:MAG: hypothetical protein JSV19_04200 [Phycisphaerales bacterium]
MKDGTMVPWVECPSIDIDLDRPVGERYADVPDEVFEKGRCLLRAIMQAMPPAARYLGDAVRLRTRNRFHAEARALAQHVGGDWRSVMVANVSYDLALSLFGCSTVALPTPDGPVLARNMDWFPERILARTSYLIRLFRDERFCFANAGWPGSIGAVTGLSGRGFAVALNAVISPEGTNKAGYPVLLHLRRVLEDADGFDSALRMLSQQRLVAPGLFTLVGSENDQRVVIERTPRRHAHRWAKDGRPLVTTNDYRLLFKPRTRSAGEIDETTCSRYDALRGLFADHRADRPADDITLLHALSDPAVIQDITAQHVILRPRSGRIRLYVPRRVVESA